MLAFAREQDLRPEAVDVSELIHGMIDLLQHSLGPSVQIETRFAPRLGRALVDPHQLELAILNLAVNGRDAMPSGGLLTISASAEVLGAGRTPSLAPGHYIRLCVADSGSGMDPATVMRATEPFFTTKGVGKGTGLGRSMVHGLAVQSGSDMRIDSNPGNGTTVELWLPEAKTSVLTAAKADPPVQLQSDRLCTILVVDDDALVRFPLVAFLQNLGHTILQASSGQEALRLLREGCAVDLVLTDQGMPGLTGMQLISAMRYLGLIVPAVLATGYLELPPAAGEDTAAE